MLMQAYDFLELNRRYGCTLEMGGNDQWSNILAGADLIDPVHQNMTLKAKWKKSETEKADNGTSEKVSKKKTDQKKMRTGNTKRFRRKTDRSPK